MRRQGQGCSLGNTRVMGLSQNLKMTEIGVGNDLSVILGNLGRKT